MKKFLHLLSLVVLVGIAASCNGSPKTLPGSSITRQYNKILKDNAQNSAYYPIRIGRYECNSVDERFVLRKMQAAGLINYSVSRYAWWEKSIKTRRQAYQVPQYFYGYYYGETTQYKTTTHPEYNFEDHYIVSVSLTKKGQNLAVNELPAPKAIEDKDLKQPEVDPDSYVWGKISEEEDWQEIPNPFIPKKNNATEEDESEDYRDVAGSHEHQLDGVEEGEDDDNVERIKLDQYQAYKGFIEDTEVVYVRLGDRKAIKARNIQIINDLNEGVLKAQAEVIIKNTNVTDFGRIIFGDENNQRILENVSLHFFCDKGWTVDRDESVFEGNDDEIIGD